MQSILLIISGLGFSAIVIVLGTPLLLEYLKKRRESKEPIEVPSSEAHCIGALLMADLDGWDRKDNTWIHMDSMIYLYVPEKLFIRWSLGPTPGKFGSKADCEYLWKIIEPIKKRLEPDIAQIAFEALLVAPIDRSRNPNQYECH